VPEEVCRTTDSSGDEQVGATDNVGEALEVGEARGSSTASVVAKPYLRGPSTPWASASSPMPSDSPLGGQVTNFRFNHSYFI